MQKRKRVYWLTNDISGQVSAIEQELRASGYHCDFFRNLDGLMSALAARRSAMIVVGDLGSMERDATAVRFLAQRPELQGVRFILANNHPRPAVMAMAAAYNFRDILPLDLPPSLWAARFMFASSTNPDALQQSPATIGMNQLASVHVPARVVWISSNQIWVESRLEAPAGTILNLQGSVADAVGLPSLKMEVLSTRNSYLFYRFSRALVCKWSVPPKFENPVQYALKDLRASGIGPSCRVFLAIESAALRSQLIEALPSPAFKLSAALHKQGISIEPKYFSPDIVIVEDAVATDGGGSVFSSMMNNVEPHVPILVLGEKLDFAQLRALFHHRPVFSMPQRIDVIRETIKHRFMGRTALAQKDLREDAVYLPADHALSFAEISVPARLSRIHPLQGTVMTNLPVGRFALVKIEAPLLTRLFGRPVFTKLTSSFKDPRPDRALHPWVADFSFSDLDREQRKLLSESLPEFVSEQLKPFNDNQSSSSPETLQSESQKSLLNAGTPASVTQTVQTKVNAENTKGNTSTGKNADASSEIREIKEYLTFGEKLAITAQTLLERTLAIPDNFREKFRKDQRFRTTTLTLVWVVGIFAGLAIFIMANQSSVTNEGKIWSDSFKAYRDRHRSGD